MSIIILLVTQAEAFQSGKPMAAAEIEAVFKRWMKPATPAPVASVP